MVIFYRIIKTMVFCYAVFGLSTIVKAEDTPDQTNILQESSEQQDNKAISESELPKTPITPAEIEKEATSVEDKNTNSTELVEESTPKTEKEQLDGYKQMTNWLISNKDSFDDVIKSTTSETKTKWFIPKVGQEVTTVAPDKKANQEYIVLQGDTIYSIARKHNVNQDDLIKWNNITSPQDLVVGQKLIIYGDYGQKAVEPVVSGLEDSGKAVENIPEYKFYRVQAGDTLNSIAKNNHMSKYELTQLNNFTENTVLSVDQIVKIKSNYVDLAKKQNSGIVKDGFLWPVVGRLLIPFGPQEGGLTNEGVNIAAKRGTLIKSTQDGVVVYVGNALKNFGNLILVQHDNNWVSAYAHVDDVLVSKGQSVKKGEGIAKVSNSGEVKSPQLHFELRYNIKPVDPLNYLNSYR